MTKFGTHIQLTVALVLGIVAGAIAHLGADLPFLQFISTHIFLPIGQIFLRMIFMIVVPMIFAMLALGVCELGQSHGLGGVAGRSLFYTIVLSSISVLLGISLVNILKPGVGFDLSVSALSMDLGAVNRLKEFGAQTKPLSQIIYELVPRNPLDSAVRALDGEIMALMFFSIVFGIALSRFSEDKNGVSTIKVFLEELSSICMRIVGFAMRLAPLAVFSIVFNTAFRLGYSVFVSLFYYVAVVVVGLLLQQFVVYPLMLRYVAKINPWQFFRKCSDVYMYAFSTSSSNATLPKSLELAETDLGIPAKISRFVLTVGATANQNGTALFEGITVLFLAQVYGVHLDLTQQIQVVLMSIVAGIGTAGVPGGSLPLIVILLQSVGIPAEGIGLVLGVDRFLDMCRTALNVSGDLVIAALVGAKESSISKV